MGKKKNEETGKERRRQSVKMQKDGLNSLKIRNCTANSIFGSSKSTNKVLRNTYELGNFRGACDTELSLVQASCTPA
jgi:hypothetical protein